jgi:hypothetical protein
VAFFVCRGFLPVLMRQEMTMALYSIEVKFRGADNRLDTRSYLRGSFAASDWDMSKAHKEADNIEAQMRQGKGGHPWAGKIISREVKHLQG